MKNLTVLTNQIPWKTILKKGIFFSITALVCAGIIYLTFTSEGETGITPMEDQLKNDLRPVSVMKIVPKNRKASVRGMGEVVPEWQTTIRTQVGGRITYLSEKLRTGIRVKKDDILVKIDNSEYQVRVAEAEQRNAVARVQLLMEKREAEEAQRNWEHSGLSGSPDSSLVLHEPQLEAARSELRAAQRNLERAGKELSFTILKAPYNGLIVSRNVNLGEIIFAGEEIAKIISTDKAEVAVQLNSTQWSLLSMKWNQESAEVIDPSGKAKWPAMIKRDSGFLSSETRLRTLYLEVDQPYKQTPPLLPGMFVQVELPGISFSGLLPVPESSVTKKGTFWYVDADNILRSQKAQPVFYQKGKVFLEFSESKGEVINIVMTPTPNMISGMKIKPVYAGQTNGIIKRS